eukprot:m.69982 g.69982  ORF g.69982 m.69982 type:complete len:924 (+) comp8616_c0_seq1:179-2950(+)
MQPFGGGAERAILPRASLSAPMRQADKRHWHKVERRGDTLGGAMGPLRRAATAMFMLVCVPAANAAAAGYNVTFDGETIFCAETPRICEQGGSGTFVPTDGEWQWPLGVRIIFYGFMLVYLFAGVALLADAFMNSIETITAKEKVVNTVDLSGHPVQYSVRIWNPTVANLTLMALGSSAPEIILSIIEVIFSDFYAGDLGPGTIVGSAAFNLFIIIGVCSYSLGSEVKSIKAFNVFNVTAVFAVLAYVWLIVILEGTSPNAVEIWEALLTLMFFPLLVVMAYYLDVQTKGPGEKKDKKVAPHEHRFTMIDQQRGSVAFATDTGVEDAHHHRITVDNLEVGDAAAKQEREDQLVMSRLFKTEDNPPPTRAYYRRLARGSRFGKSRIKHKTVSTNVGAGVDALDNVSSGISFSALSYAQSYGSPYVEVDVQRDGNLSQACTVSYETNSGSAKAGVHFESIHGSFEFEPNVRVHTLRVPILTLEDSQPMPVDNDYSTLDHIFFVELTEAKLSTPKMSFTSVLGAETGLVALRNSECTVHLVPRGGPGRIELECRTYRVVEKQRGVHIKILRVGGSCGRVAINYATRDGTARDKKDYHAVRGQLVFEDGETEKTVTVDIIDDDVYDNYEVLYFALSEPEGGCVLGQLSKAAITIVNHAVKPRGLSVSKIAKVKAMLNIIQERASAPVPAPIPDTYTEQIQEALEKPEDGLCSINGFLYICMLPWTLLLALFPPPSLAGGWLLFVVSLTCTGIVTALIGDYAALIGCCMGLSDYVTAITIVALGTSLPDTFASVLAAKTDDHADAAIVNVTGSNSVNVFLGLGVAWTIGAIYWQGHATPEWRTTIACDDFSVVQRFPDGIFYVKAGTLTFSVAVYSVCAFLSLIYMYTNRVRHGGELGGPERIRFLVIQLLFWALYIVLSSMKSEGVF